MNNNGLLYRRNSKHTQADNDDNYSPIASPLVLPRSQQPKQQLNKVSEENKNARNLTRIKPCDNLQLQSFNSKPTQQPSTLRRILKPSLRLENIEKFQHKQRHPQHQQHQQHQHHVAHRQQQVLRSKSKNNDVNAMTFNRNTAHDVAVVAANANANALTNTVADNADDDDVIAGDLRRRKVFTKADLVSKTQAYIIEYLQDSSIHGFVYLAKIGLSLIERYRKCFHKFYNKIAKRRM